VMRDLDLLTSGFNPCVSSDLLACLVCAPNNDHLHPRTARALKLVLLMT